MVDQSPNIAHSDPDDPAALRELAERLLDYGNEQPVKLLIDALPPAAPAEVTLPEGSRLLGSLVRGSGDATIVFDTALPAAEVAEFYRERLVAAGWTPRDFTRVGGFLPGTGPGLQRWTEFCGVRRGPLLGLDIAQPAGGPTHVRLTLQPPSRHNPCAHREPLVQSTSRGRIPDLAPPPGARQTPEGGGGSDRNWHSDALLHSELDPEVVIAHFASQLTRYGWRQTEAGQGARMGWSSWEFQDEDGERWQGLLLALERPTTPREYLLHLRIDAVIEP